MKSYWLCGVRWMLGCAVCLILWTVKGADSFAVEYAITMDDPHSNKTPMLSPGQRNRRILKHLKQAGTKAMLFVCVKRVNNPRGKGLLQAWSKAGHFLANHSYSHSYFHSRKMSLQRFQRDVQRSHKMLVGYKSFVRFFRFPYLKEGNTLVKRDGMRKWMQTKGYRNGHVTVDASDWYIDHRLRRRLKQNKDAKVAAYRSYYLNHMWDRARYYDALAKKLFKKPVKHTILIHHNLLNALFLGDLIKHFRSKGWRLQDADKVYQDKLYQRQPKRLPAGESILWSLARERRTKGLRYPAESGKYEKLKMDRLGL